jgi:DNA-binding transcriptional ArsR family regulator
MYDTLFGSKTRVKLLALFLSNPGHAFFVRELTRKIDEQINSVRRELLNLKAIGLVTSVDKKGKSYYEVNTRFEYYSELRKIFSKTDKNMSEEDKLASALRRSGNVQYAALMGSFVGDQTSPVDLFIVGEIDKRKLKPALSELEKEIGREANYCIMSEQEYEDRSMLFDRFLTETMSSPKKVVVDNLKMESVTGPQEVNNG